MSRLSGPLRDTTGWTHAMCQGCWFSDPKRSTYDDRGRNLLSVVRPPATSRLRSCRVVKCCHCERPTQHPTIYRTDPRAQFCDHNEDGSLIVIPSSLDKGLEPLW